MGLSFGMVRICSGIEETGDLIADIEQALEWARHGHDDRGWRTNG